MDYFDAARSGTNCSNTARSDNSYTAAGNEVYSPSAKQKPHAALLCPRSLFLPTCRPQTSTRPNHSPAAQSLSPSPPARCPFLKPPFPLSLIRRPTPSFPARRCAQTPRSWTFLSALKRLFSLLPIQKSSPAPSTRSFQEKHSYFLSVLQRSFFCPGHADRRPNAAFFPQRRFPLYQFSSFPDLMTLPCARAWPQLPPRAARPSCAVCLWGASPALLPFFQALDFLLFSQ